MQTCYSICDALWKPELQFTDLEAFEKCFPHGMLELKEFMAKYRRIGKIGFEDWQIVSQVSSAIHKMLEEGKQNKCPNLYESIIRVVVSVLNSLGINRVEIKTAYAHHLTTEEKAILSVIFPSLNLGGVSPIPLPESPGKDMTQSTSAPTTSVPQESQSTQSAQTQAQRPLEQTSRQISLDEALIKAVNDCMANKECANNTSKIRELQNTINTLIKLGGANINTRDFRGGWTPLHYAVSLGNLELVEFLVEHGANINAKDINGVTPLHIAAKNGHFSIVKFLVKHGALIDVVDIYGKTPIDYAREGGHKSIVKYLTNKLMNKPPIGLFTAGIIGGIALSILLMYPPAYLSSELYLIAIQNSSPAFAALASSIIILPLMSVVLLFLGYVRWLGRRYNVLSQSILSTLSEVMERVAISIIISGIIELMIIYLLMGLSLSTAYFVSIFIGIVILTSMLLIKTK